MQILCIFFHQFFAVDVFFAKYIVKGKVHKILLGSALFELFEIKTTWPSKARKQNKVAIEIYILQGLLCLHSAEANLCLVSGKDHYFWWSEIVKVSELKFFCTLLNHILIFFNYINKLNQSKIFLHDPLS